MGLLRKLDVRAVSLVDRPANRRKFLLFKRDAPEGAEGVRLMPLAFTEKSCETLNERLNKSPKGEDAVLSELESLSKAAGKELTEENKAAAATILRAAGHADYSNPKAAAGQLAALFGFEVKKAEEKPPLTIEKKADPAAPSLPAELEEIAKSDPGKAALLAKAAQESPAAFALLMKSEQEKATLQKSVNELTEKNRDSEAIKKAEGLNLAGVEKTKLASVIKSLDAAGLSDSVLPIMTALNKQVQTSVLFTESGSGHVSQAGSALAKMEEMVGSMIQKDGKLTRELALVKIAESNPDLYQQYMAEKKEAH